MNAATLALNPGIFPVSEAAPQRTNRANTGKEFEREIERTCGAYQSRRIARICKVDPPVRVIWIDDKANPGKKRQHVIFQKSMWVDWAGVWSARGGRMLVVECKSTSGHRLPFERHGGLTSEQVATLRTWRLAGAASCVIWRWCDKVTLWTPEMLIAAQARGDKSLLFENGIPVERGEGSLLWDFLGALERALWPGK